MYIFAALGLRLILGRTCSSVVINVARVRFGIRVWVRVRVRDSAIFEKGGCGCGGTRRLKNY